MLLAGSTVADLDMFHEMALIRESLAAGEISRYDVHAYTPTVSPVVHHEWATGAVLYFVAVVAGLGGTGILALRLFLVAGVVLCCYHVARTRGAHRIVIGALAPVAIALTAPGLAPVRAQLFTFLFVASLLVLLEVDRRGARWWPLLWLPLYVTWLNMHGGFVVGIGFLGLYAVERFGLAWHTSGSIRAAAVAVRHLALVLVGMAALTLVNPYGWEYLPYLRDALLLDRPLVAEWAPLWDSRVQWQYLLFFAVSLLLFAYAVARAPKPLRLPGLLIVLAAAFFAMRSVRVLPIYAIVWISYVPGYLAHTDLRHLLQSAWRRFAVPISVAALVCVIVFVGRAAHLRFWELRIPNVGAADELYYPAGATDYLAAHRFAGNVMTPFVTGAFVSWKLYPAVKVGMDSRYEVAYPPEAVAENVRLYAGGEGWEQIIDEYDTHAILVPAWSPLNQLLLAEATSAAGWHRVYRDDGYALFARSDRAAGLPVTDRTGEAIIGRFP
jgi:hypothetical protein